MPGTPQCGFGLSWRAPARLAPQGRILTCFASEIISFCVRRGYKPRLGQPLPSGGADAFLAALDVNSCAYSSVDTRHGALKELPHHAAQTILFVVGTISLWILRIALFLCVADVICKSSQVGAVTAARQ